ncbi:MAG: hypothetical protein O3C57_04415 [Verrucomicrobia bacterium]|nr:hypothetical protein [Verrucomicrobiota bacterium]
MILANGTNIVLPWNRAVQRLYTVQRGPGSAEPFSGIALRKILDCSITLHAQA